MKIRLLMSRAVIGDPQNIGDVIDVPNDEAARMIEAGQAEPVRSKPPEKAVKRSKNEKAAK